MFCSSCGVAVAKGLSFCNYCGAKLANPGIDDDTPEQVRPGLVVSAMVGLLILGPVAIAILVGVLKAVAEFDFPPLLVITVFSLLLLLVVEGVLIGVLLKGTRRAKKVENSKASKEQITSELTEARSHLLGEATPSVTENTTRTLEPVLSERRSD